MDYAEQKRFKEELNKEASDAFLKDVAFHYYRRLKKTTKGLEDWELRKLAGERVGAVTLSNTWGLCLDTTSNWSYVCVPNSPAEYSVTEKRIEILKQLELRHAVT